MNLFGSIPPRSRRSAARRLTPLALLAAAPGAEAQVRFSVDWNGPTVSAPACALPIEITEGDILTPCPGAPALGPLAQPTIDITGGAGGLGLSLHSGCVGHPAGTICGVEVDALSFGFDFPITQAGFLPGSLFWSSDEFAAGIVGSALAPNSPSEFACNDVAADLMLKQEYMPPIPLFPLSTSTTHRGVLDGNGLAAGCGSAYPGLGLVEPLIPSFGPLASGDNLDAFDHHELSVPIGTPYFSLDGGFPDPCTGLPNSESAAMHGFVGGDILHVVGGVATLWAPASMLGLDAFGPDTDDLDALAIFESGNGVFEPTFGPYGWSSGGSDMVLFSVRRGSAVIGMPDSLMGVPIEPGDILMPPTSPGDFPAILVPAESLGLGAVRSGTVSGPCAAFGDELDALDARHRPLHDCNSNNVEDVIDIALGTSGDLNLDGIPDECALFASSYCACPNGNVCGNAYMPGGCRNSTGVGALLAAAGSGSVMADDLVLTVSQMPLAQPALIFMGTSPVGPLILGDGLRCVGGNALRFPVQTTGLAGAISEGPGIVAYALLNGFPIVAGSTWYFQSWYRDPGGPCGNGHNLSNALEILFW